MKIGVDVDEVLANQLEKLCEFYKFKIGKEFLEKDFHSYNWWEVWGNKKEEAEEIDRQFKKSKIFDEIKPSEGAVEFLKQISEKNEIILITSRPREVEERTRRWFFDHFRLDAKIFFSGDFWGTRKSKLQICLSEGVELLIEDHKRYALDCADKGIKVILFNKPWNQNVEHENICRVNNWEEVVKKIDEVKNG